MHYTDIRSFRHKGLKRLFEKGDRSKVSARDADKIARILQRLNRSAVPADMAVPGFHLHPIKGDLKGLLGRYRPCELARDLPLCWRGRRRR